MNVKKIVLILKLCMVNFLNFQSKNMTLYEKEKVYV